MAGSLRLPFRGESDKYVEKSAETKISFHAKCKHKALLHTPKPLLDISLG